MNDETTYKIVFDNGKPYEETAKGELELKAKLKEFYNFCESHADEYAYYDAFIYDEKGEDISESQFIAEIIGDILNENAEKENEATDDKIN